MEETRLTFPEVEGDPRLNISEIEIEMLGDEIIETLFSAPIDDEKEDVSIRHINQIIEMFGVEFEVDATLEMYVDYFYGSYDNPPYSTERFKDMYIDSITAWGDEGSIEYDIHKIPILLDNYIEEKKKNM